MAVTLLHGDALEVLRTLPDCSVDAIVTDPPAGISFMGKSWDTDHGGRDNWIAAFSEIARECLRVCKPGGHALVWAIPRTSHWTATAWENGGWEVRDRVSHVFGCLSDDTEIMINGRWEHYSKAKAGNLALCYNVEDDTYSWQPIEDLYVYDYEDTAYRIQSDHTDQIVSRNHRCIVERGGTYTFAFAEDIAREHTAGIPILEGLHDLLGNLPVPHARTSGTEQDMRSKVQRGKNQRRKEGCLQATGRKARIDESEVRSLRQRDLEANVVAASHSTADLFKALQRDIAGVESGEIQRQHEGAHAQRQAVWRGESGMARRGDILPQAWQLQDDQVCALPAGLHQHGTEGRLCDGTSPDCCASHRPAIVAGGSGASHQSRPAGQQPDESFIVCDESGTQAIRGTRHTRTDLASITPFFYRGVVWCVKVPTGAFVARRNGKVFVTGNSGFPKSHDVSKAIDKAAGAEREVVGVIPAGAGPLKRGHVNTSGGGLSIGTERSPEATITAPATDAAKLHAGKGTALKPAVEDWWLLRKPITGTIAANVLEWGTGALNIDKCRVATDEVKDDEPYLYIGNNGNSMGAASERLRTNGGGTSHAAGRWPSHLIHDGSDEVVAMFPQTTQPTARKRKAVAGNPRFNNVWREYDAVVDSNGGGYNDTGSAARFFYVAKASKRDRDEGLDEIEGRMMGMSGGAQAQGEGYDKGQGIGLNRVTLRRNHHPTVKPTELMRYLCRLITPAGGVVLDPFCGSGSTGKGAVLEGFNFIGIEREADYIDIARARIAWAEAQVRQLELGVAS